MTDSVDWKVTLFCFNHFEKQMILKQGKFNHDFVPKYCSCLGMF